MAGHRPKNIFYVFLIACSASAFLTAQTGRRARQIATGSTVYNLPAVTFRGTLKEPVSKAVLLEQEDGQVVTIYRSGKTRFLKGEQVISPKQISPGAKLSVDVSKNPDGSLLAVNVVVVE